MNREQKIEAIYEKIANKEKNDAQYMLDELNANWDIDYDNYSELCDLVEDKLMIGDVLEWWDFEWTEDVFCKMWKYKCKPIEEQTDECIDYVYNLSKEKTWQQ